ncbi:MAG: type IA DNA topoisomerase, partial [Lachnospiraceae bacterium]|nr:type IA DNA topoisomerase [Lachnospiraceae bacterium]
MAKKIFIAEKPSVAKEFAAALGDPFRNGKGFMESERFIVTWCVGHLVALSYPEAYGQEFKRWSFSTLPFLPDKFKYEVIKDVQDQFATVKSILNREDADTIYVCTDSGREGEYIYRLVDQMARVKGKAKKRVWIDSQTKEEILRGIKEAKDLSAYDNLSDAAYLRAKVDYLMGINFSRALTLKYSSYLKSFLKRDKAVVSAGRVMTCVLGIVVKREWEIRNFQKTVFYRVIGTFLSGNEEAGGIKTEWRCAPGSGFEKSPHLYKDSGFLRKEDAEALVHSLRNAKEGAVQVIEKKKETKNPPLLYNLAELQNDCSKFFKISPDKTLQ